MAKAEAQNNSVNESSISIGYVTHGQASMMIYGSAAGNIVYTFTFVTTLTGRPFWAAVWIGVLATVPLALWMLALTRRLRDGNLFDVLEAGLGKIVCKAVIILYILVNIAAAVCMLNMFTGMIKVYFLPNTPSLIIMGFIVLICAMFAGSGIQALGRWLQIVVVSATLNYFLGFMLSFANQFKPEFVFPIFDTGFIEFAGGIYITAATVAEALLFLMLLTGNMPHTKKHRSSVVKGLIVWSVILSVAIIIMEGDMGAELLGRVAQAGVTVSRVIQINNFIRGLEILLLMTYQCIAVMKITIFIYSCYESSKKLFNIKKSVILLIIFAGLVLVPSAIMNSFNSGYYYAISLACYVLFPFVLLVLLLASLSAYIAKRKGKTGF